MRLSSILPSSMLILGLSASLASADIIVPETSSGTPRLGFSAQEARILKEIRAKDRAEMVRRPPPNFKPEGSSAKLKIVLVPKASKMRVGDEFWYRLEIQNVSSHTLLFWENPSFLKYGTFWDDGKWRFFVKLPTGKTKRILLGRYGEMRDAGRRRPRGVAIPGSDTMSKEELARRFQIESARSRAEKGLVVELSPGETLVSRPWEWITDEVYAERVAKGEADLYPRPSGTFRQLRTDFSFSEPGKYEIRVVFEDAKLGPPDEGVMRRMMDLGHSRSEVLETYASRDARRFGTVEALPVEIEVVR